MPDEKRPDSSGEIPAVKAPWWGKSLTVLLLALVPVAPALLAYATSSYSAREESATVKNKSEAGFQLLANRAVEQDAFNQSLRDDLQKLKDAVAQLQRRAIRPVKRREAAKVTALAAVPAPTPPPPLPSAPLAPNLDKALEQMKPAGPPSAPPKGDR